MDKVKLLDVTLRDGGYKTNFNFSLDILKNILAGLDQSGIQYIEIGYRNGSFKPIPNIGQAGLCHRTYLEECRKYIRKANLTVILHPKNVEECDFVEMKECGVDCVRICFPILNPSLGFKMIELAKKYNFQVFTNLTRVSQYEKEKLKEVILEFMNYDLQAVYLADSNGSLTPAKIIDLFSYLSKHCNIPYGFHAHDNLYLAQANAISAIKNGATYIDSSLLGFGKGAGNLKTEGIVSYLHSTGTSEYNLCKLLELAQYSKKLVGISEGFSPKDVIMGVFDISQDDDVQIGNYFDLHDYYNRAEKFKSLNKI